MKKKSCLFFKIISIALILTLLIQSSSNVQANDVYVNKNNYGQLVESNNEYDVYYEKNSGIFYVIPKVEITPELANKLKNKYTRPGKDREGFCIIVGLIITGVGVLIAADQTYWKPNRDAQNKIDALQNGWLSVTIDSKDVWVYKEKGEMYTGWVKSSGSWYYVENGYMFDPKYNKSSWRVINRKWYDFNVGGKLKELSCWQTYDGHKMYHIPNDFGAIADAHADIGGEWYSFDTNGYVYQTYITNGK